MNIVLHEPEIPQNTGNISRTCAVTHSKLHLIKPLGFSMATTKAKKIYTDVTYSENDFIMFGKESAGIPEEILLKYKDTSVRIPMYDELRSLNLSNSVAIILYEALRQQNFRGLTTEGQLHKYRW